MFMIGTILVWTTREGADMRAPSPFGFEFSLANNAQWCIGSTEFVELKPQRSYPQSIGEK